MQCQRIIVRNKIDKILMLKKLIEVK